MSDIVERLKTAARDVLHYGVGKTLLDVTARQHSETLIEAIEHITALLARVKELENPWVPIADIPEEWKDGRCLILQLDVAKIPHYDPAAAIAALKTENEKLRADFDRRFLDKFSYDDWDYGDDGIMRVGDWVATNFQDHNGDDHFGPIGLIVKHHIFDMPIMIVDVGFEDDGTPYGDYVSLMMNPWNMLTRISEADARKALQAEAAQ